MCGKLGAAQTNRVEKLLYERKDGENPREILRSWSRINRAPQPAVIESLQRAHRRKDQSNGESKAHSIKEKKPQKKDPLSFWDTALQASLTLLSSI
jgi:hypothetical protein